MEEQESNKSEKNIKNSALNLYKKFAGNNIFETIKVIVISLIIIIPIRTYLVEPFYVKGTSMEPNYYSYDYLLINKLEYRIDDINREDIVVAKFPSKDPYVIKRVIGMPGDTVELKNKEINITDKNGHSFKLEQEYIAEQNKKKEELTFNLTNDQYLLFGDNRKVSLDSRQQGPVTKKEIKGKVMVKVLNFGGIANIFNKILPNKEPNLTRSNY